MPILESSWSLPLTGIIAGIVLGAVARKQHFCTLNALERHWYANDSKGLRTWVLAAAIATALTQLLLHFSTLPNNDSFYLNNQFSLVSAIFGGTLFGLGMALVGTCGFGALVRLGGGSLRSLVIVATMGLSALATQRGVIGHFREWLNTHTALDLSWSPSQSIPDLLSSLLGYSIQLPVILILVIGLFLWPLSDKAFRTSRKHLFTAGAVGGIVAFGWLCTAYFKRTLFSPVQFESASFALPPGEILLQLIASTGGKPDYGMGLVLGVIIGAFAVAKLADDIQWEACDSAQELSRHLIGAVFMGVGGVFAMGCTIGQGVSATSMLAISAPVVFGSILLGARLGLALLMGGRPTWSLKRFAGFRSK